LSILTYRGALFHAAYLGKGACQHHIGAYSPDETAVVKLVDIVQV